MKKQILSLIAIMALIQILSVSAREMRAPLPFRNGFQRFEHYPYICENLDKCWDFDVWAGAFHRQASDALSSGTNRETLAGLYFGADNFALSELFPVGTPLPAEFSIVLSPRFNYDASGAMFGFNINHRMCCGTWDVGIRTNIPFITQTVSLENCCDLLESVTTSTLINPVDRCLINNPAAERIITTTAPVLGFDTVPLSFAYRLDCLTALAQVVNPEGPNDAMVRFDYPKAGLNGRPITEHVAINDKVIDDLQNNPVYVVAVEFGQTPALPFSMTQQQVNQLPFLPGNGELAVGQRARFNAATDYGDLAFNRDNQRTLWVVPTVDDDGDISVIAADIRGAVTPWIEDEISQIAQTLVTPIDFLRERGITFNTVHLTGAGDFDLDFYARRNFCSECHGDWYVEGITGIRFPTGKRVSNPGLLLQQPLGNNRHFEWKLGVQMGTQPCDWFAFKGDVQFYHVFSRTERVAAAFTGSRIRNIGPTVDAKVSWNYFLGNFDFTFVVPCAKNCSGVDIGYQPYFKSKDKIRFEQITALNLIGQTATLDPDVLENDTNRHGHRIKVELFHKTCSWEIFGGWLHTFAGKNIQRDSDWYLGFGMFF
ncbi:MAG: hypothetical protein AB7F19_01425 [Candidatus Babeliales bacterium]